MTKGFKFTAWVKPVNQTSDTEWLNIPVDNGTTHVTIKTPKNWKCKRKNCTTKFKHTHSTYQCLKTNQK